MVEMSNYEYYCMHHIIILSTPTKDNFALNVGYFLFGTLEDWIDFIYADLRNFDTVVLTFTDCTLLYFSVLVTPFFNLFHHPFY